MSITLWLPLRESADDAAGAADFPRCLDAHGAPGAPGLGLAPVGEVGRRALASGSRRRRTWGAQQLRERNGRKKSNKKKGAKLLDVWVKRKVKKKRKIKLLDVWVKKESQKEGS